MASLIYLASPYSHRNPAVRELRYELARLTTAKMLKEGQAAFSPIVYGKSMENMIGTDYVSWKQFNDAMLHAADEVHVLMLDGWRESKGVKYEVELANMLELPVLFIQPPEVSR